MSITVNGTTGLNFPDGTSQPTAGFVPFRNKIINGDMRIDQRNAGNAQLQSNGYSIDRWADNFIGSGRYTAQRSTTAPSGFINSYQHTVTTAVTPSATDVYQFFQSIEGLNITDLGFGTAAAQDVTVSFWVRSSITGIYGMALRNSAATRSYVSTYTVSTANTWEYKTITIPGETTGTWLTDNFVGMFVIFDLGSGSNQNTTTPGTWITSQARRTSACVNWIANSGATFNITGVQLEKGSAATAFEHRPFGTELAMCQRYYQKTYNQNAVPGSTTTGQTGAIWSSNLTGNSYPNIGSWSFAVPMRASPTIVGYNPNTGAVNGFRADSDNLTSLSTSPPGERGVSFFGSNVFVGTHVFVSCHATATAEL